MSFPLCDITKPEDLLCHVVKHRSDDTNQATIENNHKGLRNWDEEYVSFGGYFGTHGPDVFAAAPEVLRELQALVRAVRAFGVAHKLDVDLSNAEAAIAKAAGAA